MKTKPATPQTKTAKPELNQAKVETKGRAIRVVPEPQSKTQFNKKVQNSVVQSSLMNALASSMGASDSRNKSDRKMILVLLLSLGLAASVLYVTSLELSAKSHLHLDPNPSGSSSSSSIAPVMHNQVVEQHRQETGIQLNRGRIEAQYQNMISAPALPAAAQKIPAPEVIMHGASISQEPPRQLPENRKKQDPNYPDLSLQSAVEADRTESEWINSAQQQYVSDFVRNARAAGYDVKVDKNYDVHVLREPQSEPPRINPNQTVKPEARTSR